MAKYFEKSHSGCSVKNKPGRDQKQFRKDWLSQKSRGEMMVLLSLEKNQAHLGSIYVRDKIHRVWSGTSKKC